ncbi:DEKNAAC103167 [Brettanomyces naardenensis]|uniref:beta-glucosidase n=1 Tax=Brettanomyces naardenensis TaxID=13370 RepID=A0A448YML0_BRENA|nr:DEKNAAC103167 [Brettanomyces naardenensis]
MCQTILLSYDLRIPDTRYFPKNLGNYSGWGEILSLPFTLTVINSTANFDVDKLFQELTTEEKVSLIAAANFYHSNGVERLDIPSFRFSDGPNGVRGTLMFFGVPAACFPNGTSLASTFNKDLLKECGELMSVEAEHKGVQVIMGPTTNIQRGPLGGRGFESYSEDPYLAGMATASIVSGIQKSGKVASTLKHYVCNDFDHERFSSDSRVTERALREIYLEPFRLAVKYSQPKVIMTSYNKVNGVHCSENPHLLQEVLRDEWKWDGMTMSDFFGTYSSVPAIKNGLDIECPGPTKFRRWEIIKHLLQSKEGNLSEEDIDVHVRRVLNLIKYLVEGRGTTKFDFTQDEKNNTPETSRKLRKAAGEGIVLMKNDTGLLPLSKKDSIVVIGPNAAAFNAYSGGGSATMDPYYLVTPLQGIKNKFGDVDYAVGCYTYKALSGLFEGMTNDLDSSKPGVRATFYLKGKEDRLADDKPYDVKVIDKSVIFLADYEHPAVDLRTKLFYIDFEGFYVPEFTGDYKFGCQVFGTALIYIDGKLLIDDQTKQTRGTFCFSSGTVEVTAVTHLEAGRKYKVTVEYGSGITSKVGTDFGAGGLQVGISRIIDPAEEIKHAAALAKSHDKVVLCIGLSNEWESEGYDRDDMKLPRETNQLVEAVLEANPNTVIVNQSGMPVEMPWLKDAHSVVQAWYGGNESGNAIADVLFGDVVPSGKLAITWPIKNEDNPAFLNFHTEKGRVLYGEDVFVGYRYYQKLQRDVAFPFGHGLSYTEFKYENLKVATDKDTLNASVKVSNVGQVAGKEVVQLYISPVAPSIIRPVAELKAFEKVELKAGKSAVVSLSTDLKHACSYFDEFAHKWCLEAGKYKVLVGSSSADIRLTGEFTVDTTVFWTGL